MINDHEFIFMENESPVSTADAVDLTTGNSFSPKVHKQSVAAANIGLIDFAAGDGDLFLFWFVTVALTSGGAATLNVQFVSGEDEDLASPTVHRETGALAYNGGAFALGSTGVAYKWRLDAGQSWKQYLGLRFVIGAFDLTAGKFTAVLTNRVDAWKAYASGMSLGT